MDTPIHTDSAIRINLVPHDEIPVKVDAPARLDGARDIQRPLDAELAVALDTPCPLEDWWLIRAIGAVVVRGGRGHADRLGMWIWMSLLSASSIWRDEGLCV